MQSKQIPGHFGHLINIRPLFREEWLRCNGMSCEEKAMTEDLTELLLNELILGEYESPEAAQAKVPVSIIFIHFEHI